ncbi:SGNH/GDSL hydrolase family protein [Pelagicoccus enzymogenes]|uniref:SGNH/GDSL hydrolase family protein n=1 Tax=Pelagicoccus enzymogenes TaxID=2773457 RepID=UPI00280F8FE3|nr:SGNH/GDSL hydrolase family protein [Pelagicoccus enzymogenes]MDQ8199922.1 SGNH/GDSL hydrolase family protein [Pelagicoccus enzymogenes]
MKLHTLCFTPFVICLSALVSSLWAEDTEKPELVWHDVSDWGVEGRAWTEEERFNYFDRFPAQGKETLREAVWNLSESPTGMMARFETDASEIWVRYELRSEKIALAHFPATGVSGLDLYARDGEGKWRWVQAARPYSQEVETKLLDDISPELREYAAYLPLRNPVNKLEIGVPAGTEFRGLAPRQELPIVFYGTSINHGVAASRPGMVHTAILGRHFDRPVVNLGFGGNGRMEKEVGDFLERLDAAVFVIDCLPNMGPDLVSERCVPLVNQLRKAHPDTPIVLVEDRRYANSWIRPEKDAFHDRNHAALQEAYRTLKSAGVKRLYYIEGDHLFGDDSEGTVDGSHPTDLGFWRQAEVFKPVLKKALKGR